MKMEISANGTKLRNKIKKDCPRMLNTRNCGSCMAGSLIRSSFRRNPVLARRRVDGSESMKSIDFRVLTIYEKTRTYAITASRRQTADNPMRPATANITDPA